MKKFVALLLFVGMLFVTMPAMAWQTVEGGSSQWTQYEVGGFNNNAGGNSYSEGTYQAEGCFIAFGGATADGITKADVIKGQGFRAAGAYTHSESNALGVSLFGGTETSVYGEGLAGHNTYLNGKTGGSTYGVATYSYDTDNSGWIGSYSKGSGTAITGSFITKSHVPNGVTSHAMSGSFSIAYTN